MNLSHRPSHFFSNLLNCLHLKIALKNWRAPKISPPIEKMKHIVKINRSDLLRLK